MPKLRDEVDRMEIAVLAVVFLALIFHFLLSVVVSERYAEHSGIILFVSLVCGWTAGLAKSHCGSYCQPQSIVPNRSE